MAEDTQGGDGGQTGQQQQNIQLLIDERELRTIFSNGCRIHTTADEVILDFGFNMPNPNPQQQAGQQQVLYKVYDRVIMSYANVKRLANSLNQLVRRYEQQFGEIGGAAGAPGQGPRPVR